MRRCRLLPTIIWLSPLLPTDGLHLRSGLPRRGGPGALQAEILASYDFDGWMTDFKGKGNKSWRLGMKIRGDRLPFLMDLNFDIVGNYNISVIVICIALLGGAALITRLRPFNIHGMANVQ